MKFNLKGHEYSVVWRYENVESEGRRTTCFIKRDGEVIMSAPALCLLGTVFCRNCERKLTMAQALRLLRDDYLSEKEDRRAFWQTYYIMRHEHY
jgi:hypothetical protein